MSLSGILIMFFLSSLATIWIVCPRQYQRWVDGLFLSWGPAAKAAKTRVRSVFPFSLIAKPWYPTYLRVVGVFIWLALLAYLFYRT